MSKEVIPRFEGLSVPELDQRLEEAVLEHERSEQLICFALLEMHQRKGHEKFGFRDIVDYAHSRFGFSDRKTHYMMSLARKVKDHPMIEKALAEGKIGWTKAYRIVKVATPEDEAMWLESAMSMSVRELDRRIKNKLNDVVTKLRLWMSEDQSAVWEYAVEVCRRVSGAHLSMEQCLEYMAGEFLATWAFEANKEEVTASDRACPTETQTEELGSQPDWFDPETGEDPVTEEDEDAIARELDRLCPETTDLPSPSEVHYSKIARAVLERDGWVCGFPGCSARAKLHVHHIECRSHFGKKRNSDCHSLCNLVCTCVFHHRQLHAGIISVTGRAPFDLEWRRPKLMETAMMRMERRRMEIARRDEKLLRKRSLQLDPLRQTERPLQTFAGDLEPDEIEPVLQNEVGTEYEDGSSEEYHLWMESLAERITEEFPESFGSHYADVCQNLTG